MKAIKELSAYRYSKDLDSLRCNVKRSVTNDR